MVFNGPSKSRASLVRALSEGALVQIDNWDELALVEEIVATLPGPIDVGIRVCLDAGVRPAWTKFGFMLATGEAARAAARIIANPNLRLHTLHTHIGTYILDAKAYGTATKLLVALLDAIESEHGHRMACLNLGGGFASNSLLHTMAGPAEREVPQIDAYAEAITAELARLPKGRRPLLRLETGRHLVDDAGYLLTSVVAVKGMRPSFAAAPDLTGLAQKQQALLGTDSRVGYVIDAGINLLYTAAWFRIDAVPARDTGARHVPSRLYGPLCMAIDVVREEVDLPPLETGDLLTLHPVGAANSNQAMQFNDPRPAMVMVGRNGAVGLMRRRETVEDFNGPERSLVEIAKER
ncbi:MAG: diaminopimelate decarboxylase [Alphaproteobacteria bacterium]|nr:diaminopimelate decarboxylase [Alphaproteobacteria bacterium]